MIIKQTFQYGIVLKVNKNNQQIHPFRRKVLVVTLFAYSDFWNSRNKFCLIVQKMNFAEYVFIATRETNSNSCSISIYPKIATSEFSQPLSRILFPKGDNLNKSVCLRKIYVEVAKL